MWIRPVYKFASHELLCVVAVDVLNGYMHPGVLLLHMSNDLIIKFQDPVTGSAHCALAPYWSEKLGKCDFVAYQVLSLSLFINIQHTHWADRYINILAYNESLKKLFEKM